MYAGRKSEQVYFIMKNEKTGQKEIWKRMKKGVAVSQKLC